MLLNRSQSSSDTFKQQIARQQTHPYPSVSSTPHMILTMPETTLTDSMEQKAISEQKKKGTPRVVATIVVGLIALVLYIVWKPTPSAPQTTANTQTPALKVLIPTPTNTLNSTGGSIQVYIIGAVQHPGVYTLENNARVYQLLQAAGGALTSANLTVINLAARLNDGQEIYLPHVGETPIASMSGTTSSTTSGTTSSSNQAALININTASTTQLRQSLNLSSKSAQAIVDYRLQHGPFSSVDALAQVVSKTIYDKIKDKVTI